MIEPCHLEIKGLGPDLGIDNIFGKGRRWFHIWKKDKTVFVLRYLDCERDCHVFTKTFFLFS